MKFNGESNSWHLGMFKKGLFRTCGMFLLKVILVCLEIAQGSFKESFVGKIRESNADRWSHSALAELPCGNTPDTRS